MTSNPIRERSEFLKNSEKRKVIPHVQEVQTMSSGVLYNNPYEARLKALELANEHVRFLMSTLKIKQFEESYPEGTDGLIEDIKSIHRIADMNYGFLIGEKQ